MHIFTLTGVSDQARLTLSRLFTLHVKTVMFRAQSGDTELPTIRLAPRMLSTSLVYTCTTVRL